MFNNTEAPNNTQSLNELAFNQIKIKPGHVLLRAYPNLDETERQVRKMNQAAVKGGKQTITLADFRENKGDLVHPVYEVIKCNFWSDTEDISADSMNVLNLVSGDKVLPNLHRKYEFYFPVDEDDRDKQGAFCIVPAEAIECVLDGYEYPDLGPVEHSVLPNHSAVNAKA